MKSKENKVLELFYNNPKHWHFEELLKAAEISRPKLARWLNIFEKEGIIKRIKEKGKMPFYTHDFQNPKFDARKKLYAAHKLVDSGLIDHLIALQKAKVIIIFGSFSRSDWYSDSDIDIFIYGSDNDFDKGKFETKLNREIQTHVVKDKKGLRKIDKMFPYILGGNIIKGSIQDLGVVIHAKT